MTDLALSETDEPTPRARVTSAMKQWRIMRIAELMAGGMWNTGYALDLCDEWSVTETTLGRYAEIASIVLDLTVRDREKLVELCRTKLMRIAEEDDKDRVPAITAALKTVGGLVDRVDARVSNRDDNVAAVKRWLKAPTPELTEMLEECGWYRRKVVEG